MTGAREQILSSIRERLAASRPFDAVHEEHHHSLGHHEVAQIICSPSELSRTSLAEMFRENLTAIGGSCIVVNEREQAADIIREILRSKDAKQIAVSDAVLIKELTHELNDVSILDNATKDELFNCDAGITGVQWGMAETGTLVLESNSKERNRLASLVPPVHIAVLEARNIRQRMSEVLAEISTEESRAVTFITGPSRTSDIELTLAIGVHGPAELHVIIIDE